MGGGETGGEGMREREMGGGEREERKRGRKEVSINDTMSETMATFFSMLFRLHVHVCHIIYNMYVTPIIRL